MPFMVDIHLPFHLDLQVVGIISRVLIGKKKGVPRVLSATRFVIPDDRLLSPEEQKMYEYLQSHRINLNVRQVLGDDQRQEVPSEEERKKVFEKAVQASIESEILLSSSSSCSSCCY